VKKTPMAELARSISIHLQRFEADPVINKPRERLHPYWHAGAGASGRYVYVTYIGYQGACPLTRDEAEKYIAWLDAGNVGRHFGALR
jgi:hypothetical protein